MVVSRKRLVSSYWNDHDGVYINENLLDWQSKEDEARVVHPKDVYKASVPTVGLHEEPLATFHDVNNSPSRHDTTPQASSPITTDTLTQNFASFQGCWRVALFSDKHMYHKVPYRPNHDFLIDLETKKDSPASFQIRGRVYNMTVADISLEDVQHGRVHDRQVVFSSDFHPLRSIAIPDYLMSCLIREISRIHYDSRKDVLYVSGPHIMAKAYRYTRNPGSKEASCATSSRHLLNIAIQRFNAE